MRAFLKLSATGVAVLWLLASASAVRAAGRGPSAGEADAAIAAFKKADASIAKLFSNAHGYALFPTVAKGGLGFGAARGRGRVMEKGKLVGTATITQVTFGAQIGGQTFSEVIFFETPAALARFKQSRFALSAQLSAVAAADGASKNARYENGVLVFTLAKQGLMAEASIGGQKFRFEPAKAGD